VKTVYLYSNLGGACATFMEVTRSIRNPEFIRQGNVQTLAVGVTKYCLLLARVYSIGMLEFISDINVNKPSNIYIHNSVTDQI
jgi:hypothetical protein